MRVIVTGSRDWLEIETLRGALFALLIPNDPLTIVHGHCPTGADAIADLWAQQYAFSNERHPARWRQDGVFNRGAGFERNIEMCHLGADLCLAFIRNKSRGATHCANVAEGLGIPVERFRA